MDTYQFLHYVDQLQSELDELTQFCTLELQPESWDEAADKKNGRYPQERGL